jgi:hypothetical protein
VFSIEYILGLLKKTNNQRKKYMIINKFTKILLGAVLLTGTIIQAQADDTKIDPTGTYIWTQAGRNGGPDRTNTLVLKLDGGKLTGNLTAPGRGGAPATPIDITDAMLISTNITFNVVRDFNGNSMTNKYSGALADGSIKGKVEGVNRNGDPTSRDWEAKLQK